MGTDQQFGIGTLSVRSGVNVETIRYYERKGLLANPPRTPGGHRSYTLDHLKQLTFVRRSRQLDFSMEQIRKLLSLVNSGYTCGEVQSLTVEHLRDVRTKIADLRRMERSLIAISSACEGGAAPDCPIIDSLQALDG